MRGRYGHAWSSKFPTVEEYKLALHEWREVLADMTTEEVKRGLDTWDGPMPPNALEFKAICRPRAIEAHALYTALPAPKADPSVVAKEIGKMRDALRGSA